MGFLCDGDNDIDAFQFAPDKVFYIVGVWAAIASLGPAFGPVLSAYSVEAYDWHWSQWEILWLAAPILLVMVLTLPETSAATILLRRAQRLRQATGNELLRSQSEIDQAKLTVKQMAIDALIKPWEINILDPAVLYTTFYTGLVYGIFYTYFEVFPMVYGDIYGFSLGSQSLCFLAVAVTQAIVPAVYLCYFKFVFEARIKKHGMGPIEDFLVPGLAAAWLLPAGLFIFGKFEQAVTSKANVRSVHKQREYPLDCQSHRCQSRNCWCLHHYTVYVPVCAGHISQICGVAAIHEWVFPRDACRCLYFVCATNVSRHGRRRWRELSGSIDHSVLGRIVHLVLLWCEAAREKSIRFVKVFEDLFSANDEVFDNIRTRLQV